MALAQDHFRFGIDSGTEATHGWHANLDTNPSAGALGLDTTFLLRFNAQASGGVAHSNVDFRFEYNRNGAGWVAITTISSVVRAVAATALTDGGHCTQRLGGTGTFESTGAGQTEDGLSGGNANDIAANGCSETECGLQIVSNDVSNGDVIQFRITSPDVAMTHSITPSYTVVVDQTVTPDRIESTATVHTPRLDVTLLASLIASTEVVFAPSIVLAISPDRIESTTTLHTPRVDPQIVAPQIASAEQVFAPRIDPTILVNSIASTEQVFAPRVDPQVVAPQIASTETVFAPTVAGDSQVSPARIESTTTLYDPTVYVGTTITIGRVESTLVVFAPAVVAWLPAGQPAGSWTPVGQSAAAWDPADDPFAAIWTPVPQPP